MATAWMAQVTFGFVPKGKPAVAAFDSGSKCSASPGATPTATAPRV